MSDASLDPSEIPKATRDESLRTLPRRGGEDRSEPLEFAELAQGRSDVFISLDGEVYRLLRTKNHKLILTK
jgi:hemin uptake protein HemP